MKTHQAVLPQQPALESTRADTPGSRDETARGHVAETRGTGRGHGRGETGGRSTRARRRHAEQAENRGGDAPRMRTGRGSHRVFVVSRDGLPLMPCHPPRARTLLARGRAAVARRTPFTIRLRDRRRSDAEVSGVELRIDPGSRGTGLALTETVGQTSLDGRTATVRRGLVAIELRHRGPQIRQAMVRRAGYRRRRRTARLRYRPPRFANRVRRPGWLAPSLRHRVDSVCSVVARLRRFAPVVAIHVEENSFDIPALSTAEGREASDDPARSRARSGSSCAYCGAFGVPLDVDHIRARARGGTDRPANRLLACVPCNRAKAARPVEEFLAHRPGRLATVLSRLRPPPSATRPPSTRRRPSSSSGWKGRACRCVAGPRP
ncbi:RNA-guided endonuclease IscB [Streptomyces sp. E-08]|uniref:RNA-guided endonuclease IscB n=1 Tax=Streptomyces sp. E-08 TaxID=3404047 RepID=UPI003CF6EA31